MLSTKNAHKQAQSPLATAGLLLVGAGWLVAVLFADGFELHRSAFASPLIVLGALCGLVASLRGGRVMWKPALVAGAVAMLYFAVRAILSPVWDLGRHDLHLLSLAWLTIVTLATCANTGRGATWLVGGVVLVFAGHLAAGLYQQFVDRQFVLLRLPRSESQGVSGLFWHWNNLAALLALVLPLFLGIALTSRRAGLRILFAILVLLGLLLAYLTKSRAGFGAVVIGLGAVGAVLPLRRSRSWSWSARLVTWCGVGLLGIAGAVAVFLVASRASEARGHGADLSQALGKSSRLHLAGTAFDLWLQEPVVGNGSQSYRYLLLKNWDPEVLPLWLGDPETVHNEYMQVLSDYGLLGLLLGLGFAFVILSRVVLEPTGGDEDDDSGGSSLLNGLRLGAVGGLVATMAHAVVEFQLHLLPILLPTAAAVGLLAQERRPGSALTLGMQALTVAVASVLAILSVGRENLSTAGWLRWQFKTIQGGGKLAASELPAFRALVESSPHYKVAQTYGNLHYRAYVDGGADDRKLLEEARWALAIAYERNPFDQTTLVTYASVLDQLGEFGEAEEVHLRAVEMAAARENKFGALGGMGLHLLRRGQQCLTERKSEEALGFLLLARDYLQASRARKYNFGQSDLYGTSMQWLERWIELLQNGGIRPQAPAVVGPPPQGP